MTTDGKTGRVLVGVDGSDSSTAALRWAAHYAQATGSTLTAVLAWHFPSAAGGPPVGVAPASVEAEVEQNRAELIDKAIEAALGPEPPIAIERKAVYGHPAQVLIDESAGADLLVVGNRGYGGFTGMMLGSVSTHCVTHAHCPVTVVRSD
ncbi:MAG TPA: universal stress protein [Streptosporangiaceae bacterium]